MPNVLRIRNSVSFSLMDKNLSKINDDFQSGIMSFGGNQAGNKGLLVRIAATHAGIITRNNGFYLPDKMRKGAASFTQDYAKPVLLHHNDEAPPIGRVIGADYVDTSGRVITDFLKKNGNANETLIRDFLQDKMPFGQKVDVIRKVIRDELLENEGYEGLGYIQLLANITDPDAIQKLLDGRYLTGSVGATTDAAVCSVCRSDWTESGPCEHTPGGIYDSAKCFIIAGNLAYDEYSFVNVPADRHSRVLQLDYNGSTQDITVADEFTGRMYEVQLGFPQFDSTQEDLSMTAKGEQKVQDSVNQDDLDTNQNDDQVDNQDVQDETQNTGDENVQDNVDTGDENVESVEDFLVRVFDAEANGGELSEEDVAKAYGLLWDEVVAAKTEGELQIDDELLEGEKITDEKRGSLPRSSFAGPGKYFPVNDCAHIVGVRRLLNKVELSDEVKEKLVKVVDRKAKARNCGTVKKDATTKVQDNQVSRVMHSLLNAIEEDSYYSEEGKVLDEESITMLRNLLKKLSGMVGKDSLIKALTVESLVSDDTALLNEVERLEDELGEVRDRLEAVQKEYNLVYQDMDSLQDALVDEKTKTRKALEGQLSTLANLRDQKVEERDWTNLDDSAITSEVARLTEEVDMNKIADKLGDGMSRIPSGDVDSPEGAIQDDATNQVVITDDHMRQIEANYFNLLFSKGQIVADAYRAEMMRRGYFPTQGTESAGGTN